jgi:hypothetical protein
MSYALSSWPSLKVIIFESSKTLLLAMFATNIEKGLSRAEIFGKIGYI